MLLGLILIFCAIGGVLSVICAGLFLLLSEQQRQHVLPHGISFAIGALLTVAFIGLLPEALTDAPASQVPALTTTILVGILLFFILEKLLIWRHCHSKSCEAHSEEPEHSHSHTHTSAGLLIILGDSIHNFVDGILITAAFFTDIQLGIITSFAVAAHEIPQEVGDFAILLTSGYSKAKAFYYNVLSSLATVLGGLLAYFSLESMRQLLPYILALAASSFIYIAVADLIPMLHKKTDSKTSVQQVIGIALGVLLIVVVHGVAHKDV